MKPTIAKTKEDILQVIALRRSVLVNEFQFSRYQDEPDYYDFTSTIYIIKNDNNKVIGTVRVRSDTNRLQRVAIHPKYRKTGVGSTLLKHAIEKHKELYVMAPEETIPFYEKHGFNITGEKKRGKHHLYYRMQNF